MQITEGVEWIAPCTSVGTDHMHISVYLLQEGDRSVLVDTGSVVDRDLVMERVEGRLAGEPLDALLLSHTDLPHAGNFEMVYDRWPDVEIWCGSNHAPSHGLPEHTRTYSDADVVAGRQFHFIDPLVKDRTNTTWIFDDRTGVLFFSDGLGYHHASGECDRTMGELIDQGAYSIERLFAFHRTSLPWLRYADLDLLRGELDAIVDRHDISIIAPSHAPPVSAPYIEQFLEDFYEVVGRMVADYAEERRARQAA